jgi:tRNA(Ile)-lysidine synthase
MIRLLGKLPDKPVVALSGGVDSMAAADFIARTRSVACAFFHHGTTTSDEAFFVVEEYCARRDWPLFVGYISKDKPNDISPEEHWRNERYAFLDSLDADVITAHHLDDCIETYIWSTMHGTAKVIPQKRNRVTRPFLLTRKSEFIAWAERNNVPWINDFTNSDTKYMRNYVREHIVPHAFNVNPGLAKIVAKKVENFAESY